MILLIGNYPHDRQESMQRFARLLLSGLQRRNIPVELITPRPLLGRLRRSPRGVGKWLGYLDKYIVFPLVLRRRIHSLSKKARVIVHVCDHSNATYLTYGLPASTVVTCHDLLAIRGALGEDTGCPAGPAGKLLQHWILRGLGRADWIVADSTATKQDVDRLVKARRPQTRSVALLAQNYAYRPLSAEETATRLSAVPQVSPPFLLHVGSNLARKNRLGVLRIFSRMAGEWPGHLVFAGAGLSEELRAEAIKLGMQSRVAEVAGPSNERLNALYSRAFALVFPSQSEGFGWPVIEAQACGCPVVCSDRDSLPEVTGEGGMIRQMQDEEGFAEDLLRLRDEGVRQAEIDRGLRNAARFSLERMMDHYVAVYRSLGEPC